MDENDREDMNIIFFCVGGGGVSDENYWIGEN